MDRENDEAQQVENNNKQQCELDNARNTPEYQHIEISMNDVMFCQDAIHVKIDNPKHTYPFGLNTTLDCKVNEDPKTIAYSPMVMPKNQLIEASGNNVIPIQFKNYSLKPPQHILEPTLNFTTANISHSQIPHQDQMEDKLHLSTIQVASQPANKCFSLFRTGAQNIEFPLQMHSKTNPNGNNNSSIHLEAKHYFDALKGPELETLKKPKNILLPKDEKWPFLLRFPIGYFGICLGLSSQTILWKTLSYHPSIMSTISHVPKLVNLVLWCLALMTFVAIFMTYCLKCIFYFEAVRREFRHPVRVNFFFAPWIACMFLTLGVPPTIATTIYPNLWIPFVLPLFVLEIKVYGQWLSGGERRLSKVANPSTHLSLVGNFVAALLLATLNWKELATFFWSIGFAHYLVLLVTLYQRLPTANAIPKDLHPVYFLFFAAPSAASVSWVKIEGNFDLIGKFTYFLGLFLYTTLVVRVNFFRGFRFTVAWWAYTFPMTAVALATIQYSISVFNPFTQTLAILLSIFSSTMVFTLSMFTFLHMFIWRTMFPNDLAIAITSGNVKTKRKIKALKEDTILSNTKV